MKIFKNETSFPLSFQASNKDAHEEHHKVFQDKNWYYERIAIQNRNDTFEVGSYI